jgi:hypothetical protein
LANSRDYKCTIRYIYISRYIAVSQRTHVLWDGIQDANHVLNYCKGRSLGIYELRPSYCFHKTFAQVFSYLKTMEFDQKDHPFPFMSPESLSRIDAIMYPSMRDEVEESERLA